MLVRVRPRYHAKNPKYMLTTATYPRPSQARHETEACNGRALKAHSDKPKLSGNAKTNAHEITRQPPSLGVSRAPSL